MPKIYVVDLRGVETEIQADDGISVMEAARNAGIEDMWALCGGQCSCATCHVYVDAASIPEAPEVTPEEHELLEGATNRQPNSRLSCQLICGAGMDGLKVVIVPES